MGKWRYGVILDAGSSGTRLHVYRWLDSAKARKTASSREMESLPDLSTKKHWTKKIHPGVSTFVDKPDRVGPDHLAPLLRHALDNIPKQAVRDTPIFLLATAGMRLLPLPPREELLAQICSYARSSTDFLLPDCDRHVQIIPGETEGLYGWIAANYLLGGFDAPEDHAHGKGHHTYGFLDMGGASAQIAFAPNATEATKHAEDLKLLRLRTVNGAASEYRVFVATWLGFGVNEARKRYIAQLLDASPTHDAKELPDPCLPVGLTVTKKGDVISTELKDVHDNGPVLIGTGRFSECLRSTYPLLEKDIPCTDEPCLLNGLHVPAIDFDVNHFVGVSEYWHTTHEVFEMSHKEKSYDFNTYQNRVKDFCSQDWKSISKGVNGKKWGKKVNERTAADVCFKASWLINVLHDGIGIPRVTLEDTKPSSHNATKEVLQHAKEKGFLDPFQAVDKIKDTEVSWTLGRMVLYAASQVPPTDEALAVGFGSNRPGVPADFQYAGTKYAPLPHSPEEAVDETDIEWQETLFNADSPRRIPGFLLFVIIIGIVFFLWCGRERRSCLTRRVLGLFGRATGSKKRKIMGGKLFGMNGPRSYERVLEDGDAATEFELGEADSDNDHSDSSDGSRAGRASGWATPSVKMAYDQSGSAGYFDNVVSQGIGLGLDPPPLIGNAMDRSGLVVRTESRERLTPGVGRSRTGSPVRNKSPLMTRSSPKTPHDGPYD
ncbi:MAG: Golgi apyrase [Caeruleum heppii]|nr:MAG: Golgi apyrase [Caeruleum heppii]